MACCFCFLGFWTRIAFLLSPNKYVYIYIYTYIDIRVCVCVLFSQGLLNSLLKMMTSRWSKIAAGQHVATAWGGDLEPGIAPSSMVEQPRGHRVSRTAMAVHEHNPDALCIVSAGPSLLPRALAKLSCKSCLPEGSG